MEIKGLACVHGFQTCPRIQVRERPGTTAQFFRILLGRSLSCSGRFWRVVVSEIRPHAPGFGSIAIGSETDSGLPEVPRNLRSLRTEDI